MAGAFVELDDEEGSSHAFDDIKSDPEDILAQLKSSQASERGGSTTGEVAAPSVAPSGPPPGLTSSSAATQPNLSVMMMTAEEVFSTAGVVDGPNSATKALKLIAGLAMFPAEQQVVMVRAMDTADDSWTEGTVLDDARARQSLLRSHLDAIASAKANQISTLESEITAAQKEGTNMVQDLEKQITNLQAKLAETVALTSEQISMLRQSITVVQNNSASAQKGISLVVNALSGLITFFSGGRPSA